MRLLIFILLFISLFSISLIGDDDALPSGTFVDPNIPKIDYNSPLTYNVASFWGEGTDYDKVQWNQVQFNQIPWESVDQSQVPSDYINQIPITKINVETVSDQTKITSEQWEHEDNLNKAGDLSQYPSAQKAVFDKHSPGFQKIDLANGNTVYENGVLTNGDVSLDLNYEKIKGTEIIALAGGGFSIAKGEGEGLFAIGNLDFDITEAEGAIKITGSEVILSKHAMMFDPKTSLIESLSEGTKYIIDDEKLIVEGVALIIPENSVYRSVMVGISGEEPIDGKFIHDYSDQKVTLKNCVVETSDGTEVFFPGGDAVGKISVLDGEAYQNIIKDIDVSEKDSFAEVQRKVKEHLFETGEFVSKKAEDLVGLILGPAGTIFATVGDSLGLPVPEGASQLFSKVALTKEGLVPITVYKGPWSAKVQVGKTIGGDVGYITENVEVVLRSKYDPLKKKQHTALTLDSGSSSAYVAIQGENPSAGYAFKEKNFKLDTKIGKESAQLETNWNILSQGKQYGRLGTQSEYSFKENVFNFLLTYTLKI
jgi:hypothetical protein